MKCFYSLILLCFMLTMQVVASGTIKKIDLQGNQTSKTSGTSQLASVESTQEASESVILTIETTVGRKYQIQALSNLLHGRWTNIEDAFIADAQATIISFPRRDTFTFFRVLSMKKNETAPHQPQAPTSPPPAIPETLPES